MALFYFLAFLFAMPFFALALLTVGAGKMERPAFGALNVVMSAEESALRWIENALWRRYQHLY